MRTPLVVLCGALFVSQGSWAFNPVVTNASRLFRATAERAFKVEDARSQQELNQYTIKVASTNPRIKGGGLVCSTSFPLRTSTGAERIHTRKFEGTVDASQRNGEITVFSAGSKNSLMTYECIVRDVEGRDFVKFQVQLTQSIYLTRVTDVRSLPEGPLDAMVLARTGGLMFRNHSARLKVRSLRSDDGTIVSWTESEQAAVPVCQNGQSGGRLEIEAQDVSGHLNLELRGQHAGNQTAEALALPRNQRRCADATVGNDAGHAGSFHLSYDRSSLVVDADIIHGTPSDGSFNAGVGSVTGTPEASSLTLRHPRRPVVVQMRESGRY